MIQEEFNCYKETMKEEMIQKQNKYEEELTELKSQLQQYILQASNEPGNEGEEGEDKQLKQQVTFQQKQIQSLKVSVLL